MTRQILSILALAAAVLLLGSWHVCDKPDEQSQTCLSFAMASNFRASESRSQACLDYAERSRKSQRKRTFKNTIYHKIGCTSAIKKQNLRLFFCIAFGLHYLCRENVKHVKSDCPHQPDCAHRALPTLPQKTSQLSTTNNTSND